MMSNWYRRDGDVIALTLHVQPGAKHTEIAGLHGDALKIRLAASPVEGRANQALLKFIAEIFDVSLRQITLQKGGKSHRKVIHVKGSGIAPASVITT